jgi:hypothetical protein
LKEDSELLEIEWLDPWWSTDIETESYRQTFLWQLKGEVAPGHELFGIPVRMIGKRDGNDDTLFELLDGSGRVAEVHLVWSSGSQPPPFPLSRIFANLEVWKRERMEPDHAEFQDEPEL